MFNAVQPKLTTSNRASYLCLLYVFIFLEFKSKTGFYLLGLFWGCLGKMGIGFRYKVKETKKQRVVYVSVLYMHVGMRHERAWGNFKPN